MARPEKQIDEEVLAYCTGCTCGRIAKLTGYKFRTIKTRLRRFVSLGLVSETRKSVRVYYTKI